MAFCVLSVSGRFVELGVPEEWSETVQGQPSPFSGPGPGRGYGYGGPGGVSDGWDVGEPGADASAIRKRGDEGVGVAFRFF